MSENIAVAVVENPATIDYRRQLRYLEFRSELKTLLNRNSMENGSNTPDFILADYLLACLAAWDKTTLARDKWFGANPAAKAFGVN